MTKNEAAADALKKAEAERQAKRRGAARLNKAMRKALAGMTPPDDLTVTQWAEAKRRLSAESAAEPGPWRTERTPYLREPMDAFTDPKVRHIVMVAASQVGKSEFLNNCIGYIIDEDPGSNLQGQITHWQTYNDNLASLRDRAGDIEGLTEMIGSFADGSSDSVNAVAGMAAASDEELAAMVESWNKLREEQNKAAEDIADFRTGFSETMDAISGDLEAAIDDMDLGTEAAEAGRATIQGFIDGATGMLSTVQSAYSQLGYAALAALSRNVQNNNSVASSRRMSGFSRYASGTTSAEAGLALVGEEGPEFVMMHGGEAVLNAADTHSAIEAMTSTSDSSVPVQVNITVEGDVNDGVMKRLETYGEEFAAQVRAVIREDNINAQRGAYR